jgi:hypothetical protein
MTERKFWNDLLDPQQYFFTIIPVKGLECGCEDALELFKEDMLLEVQSVPKFSTFL